MIETTLSDKHRVELHASGLTDATIAAAGLYSAEDKQVADILGWQPKEYPWRRGLVFPYVLNGEVEPTYQRVKLDRPRQAQDGSVVKYESPRRKANRTYFPPGFDDLRENGKPLVITEGGKNTGGGTSWVPVCWAGRCLGVSTKATANRLRARLR